MPRPQKIVKKGKDTLIEFEKPQESVAVQEEVEKGENSLWLTILFEWDRSNKKKLGKKAWTLSSSWYKYNNTTRKRDNFLRVFYSSLLSLSAIGSQLLQLSFVCVAYTTWCHSLLSQSGNSERERERARAAAVGLEADDEQRPLHTHTAEADTHIHVCIPAAELRGKEEVWERANARLKQP